MTIVRSRARTATLVSALALTLGLIPGCGSDDPEGSTASSGSTASNGSASSQEETIKQVFDDWQASFIAGDGDAVCSRLTASGRREILAARQSAASAGPDASCEEVVRTIVQQSNDAGLKQQPSRALSVRIEGDTAIAMVSDAGRKPQPVKFVKQDGEWKLPSAGFDSQ